jgi:SAM-dependent methyltransferase
VVWYESYFKKDWMKFRDAEEMMRKTSSEVDFLEGALHISPPARVVDVGCGFGRHAVEFSVRGFQVTGIDLSDELLEEASRASTDSGTSVTWLEMDMRNMEFTDKFDAAVCLYTSFGYFDEAQNLDVLRRMSRALIKNGRLVLDVENRDGLLLRYQPRDWYRTKAGDIVLENREFDPVNGRQRTEMTLISKGRTVKHTLDIRWYSIPELKGMLAESGLRIETLYGGLDGSKYCTDSWRMVIVAAKT